MAHKVFGKRDANETESPEPISFDLADEENITCRKRVNGKLLMELVGKVDSGSVSKQTEGILQVFEVTVLADDGENPDGFTGKKLDKHSTRELQEISAANIEAARNGTGQLEAGIDPTSSLGRLIDLLDDPDTDIEMNELAEMVGWIVEQYTARPTGNAGNSPGGSSATSPTSRRARRSQARAVEKSTRKSSTGSPSESSSSSV